MRRLHDLHGLHGHGSAGGATIWVSPLTVDEGATGAVLTFSTSLSGTLTFSLVPGHDAGGHASIDGATGVLSLTAGWTEEELADIWVQVTNGSEVRFGSTESLGVTMVPDPAPSLTSPVILTAASGTFTVPAGVTSLTLYAFGAAADGQSGIDRPRGGGSGGYSKVNSLAVTPGEVLNYQVAQHGTTDTTWFKDTSTVLANSANGPTGASTTGAVGDVKLPGANGGGNATGSVYVATGGAGAPGPHGAGAPGGGILTSGDGGSGGGGADGGSAGGQGSGSTSGVGGNNRSATGAGPAATSSTPAGDGIDGGGGGGGDDTDTYSGGGEGSFEAVWTDPNSSTSIGPGSGGGGAGNGGSTTPVNPRVGGAGGPAGGGGGGRETGGSGGNGFIVVEWA